MKEKAPITIVRKGKIIGIFASLRDASRALGLHPSTIAARIENGTTKDETTFRYSTAEETSVIRTLAHLSKGQDDADTPPIPKPVSPKRKPAYKTDDKPIEGTKYALVKYDITADRRCITPCPYHDAPKPMVGSAGCARCPSFHGRDRQKHQVACSFRRKSLM